MQFRIKDNSVWQRIKTIALFKTKLKWLKKHYISNILCLFLDSGAFSFSSLFMCLAGKLSFKITDLSAFLFVTILIAVDICNKMPTPCYNQYMPRYSDAISKAGFKQWNDYIFAQWTWRPSVHVNRSVGYLNNQT